MPKGTQLFYSEQELGTGAQALPPGQQASLIPRQIPMAKMQNRESAGKGHPSLVTLSDFEEGPPIRVPHLPKANLLEVLPYTHQSGRNVVCARAPSNPPGAWTR